MFCIRLCLPAYRTRWETQNCVSALPPSSELSCRTVLLRWTLIFLSISLPTSVKNTQQFGPATSADSTLPSSASPQRRNGAGDATNGNRPGDKTPTALKFVAFWQLVSNRVCLMRASRCIPKAAASPGDVFPKPGAAGPASLEGRIRAG